MMTRHITSEGYGKFQKFCYIKEGFYLFSPPLAVFSSDSEEPAPPDVSFLKVSAKN